MAAAVFDELHVAEFVRFCVVPSEKWPVAVNACVAPASAIAGFCGLTTRVVSTDPPLVTVRIVEPFTFPSAASIMLVPAETPVASPLEFIVATLVVAEVHVTVDVIFFVLLSLYVPVAVNCCVAPF